MKIEYGQLHIDNVKARSLGDVNHHVRMSRQEILEAQPEPVRRMFVREFHKVRIKVFKAAGAPIKQGQRVYDRESSRVFMRTLPVARRVEIHKALSDEIKKIGVKMKLPAVVELETMRNVQLDSVSKSTRDEDALSVSQMTRDLSANIVQKHKAVKSNGSDSGLSE